MQALVNIHVHVTSQGVCAWRSNGKGRGESLRCTAECWCWDNQPQSKPTERQTAVKSLTSQRFHRERERRLLIWGEKSRVEWTARRRRRRKKKRRGVGGENINRALSRFEQMKEVTKCENLNSKIIEHELLSREWSKGERENQSDDEKQVNNLQCQDSDWMPYSSAVFIFGP